MKPQPSHFLENVQNSNLSEGEKTRAAAFYNSNPEAAKHLDSTPSRSADMTSSSSAFVNPWA